MIPHFKTKEHAFLSNFHLVDVELNGRIYPSVEHAYMSAKSDDIIRSIIDKNGQLVKIGWKDYCSDPAVTAGDVKRNSREVTLVPNWDEVKFDVMRTCLKSKFSHPELRIKLIDTGNQNIQEGNWHGDRIWGVDLKVTPNIGENHLGRMLMQIRDEIK